MSEVNPNHPVTVEMHEQWHKVAALLMHQFGVTKFRITPAVMDDMPANTAIVAYSKPDGLYIYLVDEKTARQWAGDEGGLPH